MSCFRFLFNIFRFLRINPKSSATKKLTFLFNTMDLTGTMNPMIELAKCLRARGHTIVFIAIDDFKDKLENELGFTYVEKPKQGPNLEQSIEQIGLLNAENSLQNLIRVNESGIATRIVREHIERENKDNLLKDSIAIHKPDVIVLNSTLGSVEALASGKPWVGVYCESPLDIYRYCGTNANESTQPLTQQLPPFMSGFKTFGENDPNLIKFNEQKDLYNKNLRAVLNKSYEGSVVPQIADEKPSFQVSNHLNLYCYPKQLTLDYEKELKLDEKVWFRVDSYFCSQSSGGLGNAKWEDLMKFITTSNLDGKKLIYVSMGTIGSLNLKFMTDLVKALSKSEHHFIVSKGERHDKINTSYENMYGERYLPQTSILPEVELFITHGGNNSVSEAFYFGKPMIVYPFIFDQYDNAQRIDETGFGKRLDAQNFDENELKQAIDNLLADKRIDGCVKKMEKASNRIRSENRLNAAVVKIEGLIDRKE